MKTFLIVGGIFIIVFVCLVPLKRNISEYDTQQHGQLITAVITEVPNCIGIKAKHFIKFCFNDTTYSKAIGAPCDQYKVGKTIELKHKPGTNLFLYMNETKESDFISTGLLALAGFAFIIIGLRKEK